MLPLITGPGTLASSEGDRRHKPVRLLDAIGNMFTQRHGTSRMEAIGIDFVDLISSVQVCRAWNKILTPVLWHTVNTNSQHWSYIIKQEASGERTREEIESCVKSVFEKHGRHIRNLESNWRVVLKAATLGGNGCKNLSPHWCLAIFTKGTLCNQKSWRRYTIGRFWILVQQNPGLVRLRSPRLGVMNDE
ncbi:hypothetical protein F5H01DRAFT_373510 [Linnemannia elongata]|nr:hypothetical protein F5H01DRAFT_373510 [Linnemannia elongata]